MVGRKSAQNRLPNKVILIEQYKKAAQRRLLSWFLEDHLPALVSKGTFDDSRVEVLKTQGWSNHAFVVRTTCGTNYIIRMCQLSTKEVNAASAYGDWSNYHKEAWAMNNVAELIPVPTLVNSGIGYINSGDNKSKYAYMVETLLPFADAAKQLTEEDNVAFYTTLGKIAKVINTVLTPGFGTKFNSSAQTFQYATWLDCIQDEIEELKITRLEQAHFFSKKITAIIRTRLNSLKQLRFKPTLYHNDFLANWANVLVDGSKQVKGIIDWEHAGSGPALYRELASTRYVFYRRGLPLTEIEKRFSAVLCGYEISEETYQKELRYHVETVVLIHAIKGINKYIDIRKNGEMEKEPFREVYAQRARNLIMDILNTEILSATPRILRAL